MPPDASCAIAASVTKSDEAAAIAANSLRMKFSPALKNFPESTPKQARPPGAHVFKIPTSFALVKGKVNGRLSLFGTEKLHPCPGLNLF
jgi:hypothetical protein